MINQNLNKKPMDEIKHIKVKRLELASQLRRKDRFRVSIFGSARIKIGDKVYQQVFDLAEKVGENAFDLVTGGGPGLMEAANAGHMAGDQKKKADSIGLIIKLPWENKGNDYLEISKRFKYFSKRLDTFLSLSDVMVVTKGGIGSMLELYYMWQHLQVHLCPYKPIILIGKMWEDLIHWMKKEVLPENLVSPEDFDFIYIAHNNNEAIKMIKKFHQLKLEEKTLRKIICHGSKCVIPNEKKERKLVITVNKLAIKKPLIHQ